MPPALHWWNSWRCSQSLQDAGLPGSSPLPESAGEGTVGITFCSWQELNSEMKQHQEDLATLEQLAAELGSCGFAPGACQQQEKLQTLKKDFLQLQKVAKERCVPGMWLHPGAVGLGVASWSEQDPVEISFPRGAGTSHLFLPPSSHTGRRKAARSS